MNPFRPTLRSAEAPSLTSREAYEMGEEAWVRHEQASIDAWIAKLPRDPFILGEAWWLHPYEPIIAHHTWTAEQTGPSGWCTYCVLPSEASE